MRGERSEARRVSRRSHAVRKQGSMELDVIAYVRGFQEDKGTTRFPATFDQLFQQILT